MYIKITLTIMVVAIDSKFTWNNNVDVTNLKQTSISPIITVASKTAATSTIEDQNADLTNKRLESVTDDEVIRKNLKELMEKKHQEERKANGRLVAVILASLVIFLAIYHAWIRNSGMLAGILVPAIIMFSFAGWVIVLSKRDKAKREVFEKYLQEVVLKNRQELEAKSKRKSKKSDDKKSSKNILLHYENEISTEQIPLTHINDNSSQTKNTSTLKSKAHRKYRKHRNAINSDSQSTTTASSGSWMASHYATKDLRVKRPSIRQKLFRQTGNSHVTHTLVQAIINAPVPQATPPLVHGFPIVCAISSPLLEAKRKRLKRLDSLHLPTMVRMGSAP